MSDEDIISDEELEDKRHYKTRRTNKKFKVLRLLDPTREPSTRKKRSAEEIAAEKRAKEERDAARVAEEEARKKAIEEIAEMEDKELRTMEEKKNVHPRCIEDLNLPQKDGDATTHKVDDKKEGRKRKASSQKATKAKSVGLDVPHQDKTVSQESKTNPPPRHRRKAIESTTTDSNTCASSMNTAPPPAGKAQALATRPKPRPLHKKPAVENTANTDEAIEPPSKKRKGVKTGTEEIVAEASNDGSLETAFAPRTPAITKDRHTIELKTPGEVPSEIESEGDNREDPDSVFIHSPITPRTPNDDDYWPTPITQRQRMPDDDTPWKSTWTVPRESNAEEAAAATPYVHPEVETPMQEVAKRNAMKGKGKKKATTWEEIKAKRREKTEIGDTIVIDSSPDASGPPKPGLQGLIANWQHQVQIKSGPNAAKQPTMKPSRGSATSSTSELTSKTAVSAQTRTTLITAATIGPTRTAIEAKQRPKPKPYSKPSKDSSKSSSNQPPKPPGFRQDAPPPTTSVKEATSVNQPNTEEDEEDEVEFAATYGGLGDEEDSREQELVRSAARNNANRPARSIIQMETASPLPTVRRRVRVKREEDTEGQTSKKLTIDKLPEGCLGSWASYFLPGVVKLHGARLEPWNPNNFDTVPDMQKLWKFNYGEAVKHTIAVSDPVFRGSDKKLSEWRSNIGSTALAAVQSFFDISNLNTLERQHTSAQLLDEKTEDWLYGTNPETDEEEVFYHPLILQTYAQHMSMIENARHPADFDGIDNIELQHGGIAMAAIAVRRAFTLWRDGHITCESINKCTDAIKADDKNAKASLKKNLHLTKAIAVASGFTKKDVGFNRDTCAELTDSLALLATDAFGSTEAMEAYNEAAACYQTSASSRKGKSSKAVKDKAAKVTGPAARFLKLPTVRNK